jgi:hypothetical protein
LIFRLHRCPESIWLRRALRATRWHRESKHHRSRAYLRGSKWATSAWLQTEMAAASRAGRLHHQATARTATGPAGSLGCPQATFVTRLRPMQLPTQAARQLPLGGLAEFERELIRNRTGEGRKSAQDRGVIFGRPRKLTPHQRQEALARLAAGETQADIARTYAVDPTTIGRLQA